MPDVPGIIGETDHFWYRIPTTGPYVDSQRGNKAFGRGDGRVWLSEDCGRTWPHSIAFPDAENVTFSCILRNGNILFATRTELFLSTDNLGTLEPITVKERDGSDYVPHTPADPNRPGWYFHSLSGQNCFDVNGAEMLVWGNYCNVLDGAAPVNIYCSTDGGRTVKIAHRFGQNPYWQDGESPARLLGDPNNPIICRHVHTVAYNPDEDAFYTCTGDFDKPEGRECHWLRGTHDVTADDWDWQLLLSVPPNSRFKSGGITFIDGLLYWISDSNVIEPFDRGIFRCAPDDLKDLDKHECLYDPGVEVGCMIIHDGVFLAGHCAPATDLQTGIVVSIDAGRTWAQYDLAECGARSPVRFHAPDSDGWFRVDLRSSWVTFGEVLFIKPKTSGDTGYDAELKAVPGDAQAAPPDAMIIEGPASSRVHTLS